MPWAVDSYREASPPMSAPYEIDSLASEKSLKDPEISGGDLDPRVSPCTLTMVVPGIPMYFKASHYTHTAMLCRSYQKTH